MTSLFFLIRTFSFTFIGKSFTVFCGLDTTLTPRRVQTFSSLSLTPLIFDISFDPTNPCLFNITRFCTFFSSTVDEGLQGQNVQLQLVPMLCLIARQKPISWPIKELGFTLHKGDSETHLCDRWQLTNVPSTCGSFSVEHTLCCRMASFYTTRHRWDK